MVRRLLLALALTGALAATPALADDDDPLFVNLTTEEGHRADMALLFSKGMMERGHPVTIWLNDKAVLLAAKENAGKFAGQQQALGQMMANGATVLVCPSCAEFYGVKTDALIDGAKVGNPDLTGGLLFKDDTQTLTW